MRPMVTQETEVRKKDLLHPCLEREGQACRSPARPAPTDCGYKGESPVYGAQTTCLPEC